MALSGLILYLLFFSKFLDVKDISVTGIESLDKNKFDEKLNDRLNSRWLYYIESQKNVLFFDVDNFKAEILDLFPEVKDVFVDKKLPHNINISVKERKVAGVWCFIDNADIENCKYFDEEKKVWGNASRSSGFLILNIEDFRKSGKQEIDGEFLDDMNFVYKKLAEMDILINKFVIPEDFFGDFQAHTSRGYRLLLNTDSNLAEQLDVLKIFLTEKQKEYSISGGFKPQYIDLRIDGRIYYN